MAWRIMRSRGREGERFGIAGGVCGLQWFLQSRCAKAADYDPQINAQKDAGAHDVKGDPKFAQGRAIPYPVNDEDIWTRKMRVSQVLALYRQRYAPVREVRWWKRRSAGWQAFVYRGYRARRHVAAGSVWAVFDRCWGRQAGLEAILL